MVGVVGEENREMRDEGACTVRRYLESGDYDAIGGEERRRGRGRRKGAGWTAHGLQADSRKRAQKPI